LKAGEDWRWQTHLANLPVYYEFKNNKIDLTSNATHEIKFQYGNNFKNIFDLYTTDSVIDRKNVGVKTVDNSMAEFALEECAMVQNGNWAWGQIAGVSGNKVKADNVKYLPIYTGVAGEESQGLCVGTENFYCINKKASKEDQKATADFIYWLYSSKTGKNYVTNKLGFIAPFDTFADNEKPTDPLAKEILRYMDKKGSVSVAWNFTLFPSQTFKDIFGADLLQYCQGSKDWNTVSSNVINNWKKEWQLKEAEDY
jgi:raffinose/stachyose/melibiose transport system substrate-binding protein